MPTGVVPACVRRRSPLFFRLFQRYTARYTGREFHAVRLATERARPLLPPGPLIVVLNHPSWWDPLICLILAARFADRVHYAPMEASALARYRFMERLGAFGIDPGTMRGGRDFLRTAHAVLDRPDAVLWVTAQGRFADPRERPTRLMPGVGHLASRLDGGSVLPLALEYPFWEERTPEALAGFGTVLPLGEARSPREWTDRIASTLEATQNWLARLSQERDPAAFETIRAGRAGVGAVYDGGRRLRAWLRGERFEARHGRSPDPLNETA